MSNAWRLNPRSCTYFDSLLARILLSVPNGMKKSADSKPPLGWMQSLLLAAAAVACFHLAYTPLQHPAFGLFIFGYAIFLAQLPHQKTARRAFYFGLATGFLCVAPQLYFFWKIFSVSAIVLWLVLSFWIGLFAAIVCACIQRWGRFRTMWLVPFIWTGLEYLRSELYYLKFSWLNVGYAAHTTSLFGMYCTGFVAFALFPLFYYWRQFKLTAIKTASIIGAIILVWALWLQIFTRQKMNGASIPIAGVQMEFPPESILPETLNHALKKYPAAQIFVLSEYTLQGPVPESLKAWCRKHSRYLVVGGEDPVGTNNYYDTAFVVGTNGDVVFKQAKSVPIQFFKDGLPAKQQKVWNSPWGKIGICICYDLSYTRVTDALVRQGAQLLIVPTMDVGEWGRHEHELHALVAPTRAAEYGIPIFRLASSGISQAVDARGRVVAKASYPGNGDNLFAKLQLPGKGSLPLDRLLAPFCIAVVVAILILLTTLSLREWRSKRKSGS
jgi:apolipoprotein N-acyltransferase